MKTTNKDFYVPACYLAELGGNAAYVLKVLAYRQKGAKRTIGGKLYFFCPLGRRATTPKAEKKNYRPLSDDVPWLSVSALSKIVNQLASSGKILIEKRSKGKLNNSAWYDNTLNYHVPDEVCKKCVNLKKECNAVRWFNPDEACKFNLNCALVLNLVYREFRLTAKEDQQPLRFHYSAISRDLSIPRPTVMDVFKKLEEKLDDEQQYLTPLDLMHGRAYTLNVPNPCTLKANGKGRKRVSTPIEVVRVSNTSNPMNPYQQFSLTVHNSISTEILRIFLQAYIVFLYFVDVAGYEYIEEVRTKRTGKLSPKKRSKRAIAKKQKRKESRREQEANLPEKQADRLFETRMRRGCNKTLKAAGKTKRYRTPEYNLLHGDVVESESNPVALSA